MSDEHFTGRRTLIERGESEELSTKTADRRRRRDFRGQSRTNDTHASTTDSDARLYRDRITARRSCPTSAIC